MLNLVPRAEAPEDRSQRPPFFSGPLAFVLHYVRSRPWHFTGLVTMVLGAAGCAIAVQYVMKLLVDAMVGPRDGSAAWTALAIFIGLLSIESLPWRVSGWLGCRTTVGAGVQMRLDLFDYLNGQPMRYFADNLAGSLGQRLTATAGNFGALTNTMVWRILPPCVDFIGALIIFALVDTGMMLALAAAVVVILTGLILFGERGRPLHRTYAGKPTMSPAIWSTSSRTCGPSRRSRRAGASRRDSRRCSMAKRAHNARAGCTPRRPG